MRVYTLFYVISFLCLGSLQLQANHNIEKATTRKSHKKTGPMGPMGPKGDKGDKGDQGVPGAQRSLMKNPLYFEDFISGSNTSGSVGSLGWNLYSPPPFHDYVLSENNHPGIYRISMPELARGGLSPWTLRLCLDADAATGVHGNPQGSICKQQDFELIFIMRVVPGNTEAKYIEGGVIEAGPNAKGAFYISLTPTENDPTVYDVYAETPIDEEQIDTQVRSNVWYTVCIRREGSQVDYFITPEGGSTENKHFTCSAEDTPEQLNLGFGGCALFYPEKTISAYLDLDAVSFELLNCKR
jgi:hypothetical protein